LDYCNSLLHNVNDGLLKKLEIVHSAVTFYWCCMNVTGFLSIVDTDMYEVPDAVSPIHAVSSHVATDKDPSKFRSIFSDKIYNQSQLAKR